MFVKKDINRLSNESKDAKIQLTQQLLAEEQQLLTIKSELSNSMHQRWKDISQDLEMHKNQEVLRLRERMADISVTELLSSFSDQSWQEYTKQCSEQVKQSSQTILQLIPNSHDWMDAKLISDFSDLSITMPYLPTLDLNTLKIAGQEEEIEIELQILQQQLGDIEKKTSLESNDLESQLQNHRNSLGEIYKQQQTILSQAIPMIEEKSNSGSKVGRLIGECADIVTLFVNPATVGSKVASQIGKGGKLAEMVIQVGKTANVVDKVHDSAMIAKKMGDLAQKGLELKQADQLQQFGLGNPSTANPNLPVMPTKTPMIGSVMSQLEKLSFGYWGEKIGSFFNSTTFIQDRKFIQEQQKAVENLNHQSGLIRQEILELEERLSKEANNAILKESLKRRLENKATQLGQLQERQQQQQNFVKKQHQEQTQAKILTAITNCQERSILRFLSRVTGIETELRAQFFQFWKTDLQQQIVHREEILQSLEQQIQNPRQLQKTIQDLEQQLSALHQLQHEHC